MKDGTMDRIIEKASELYTERGVYGTSLGDVASAVGISKGTLYYHCPSKQELTNAVSARCISAISDRLFAWVDSVKPGASEEALGGLCDAMLGEDMLLRLFIAINNSVEPESELEASLDRAMNEWNVMIEVGSIRLRPDLAAKVKRMLAAVLPFLCGLSALNADSDYAKQAFIALIGG